MMRATPLVTSRPDMVEARPPSAPVTYATFPASLAFALSTVDTLTDDVKIDRATDGTGRAQSFYTGPKHSIDAALNGLSAGDWAAFDDFYRTNRAQPFTIPWGPCDAPTDLPVMFATPPKRIFLGTGRSTVTFTLVEFP